MTPKGYLIVEAKVSDPAAYEICKGLAQAAIAQYGGRYLVRGGTAEILEGRWTRLPRLVIVEFESADQAGVSTIRPNTRQRARRVNGCAEMNMLVVAGY